MSHKSLITSHTLSRSLARITAVLFFAAISPIWAQPLSEARALVEARHYYSATLALTELVKAQSLDTAELAQVYYLRGESQYQRNYFAEARADFQRAYELDDSLELAAFRLGLAERYGWGSEHNPARAQELLRQAADAGVAPAAMELASIYLSASPADRQQGLAALQEASGLGETRATFTLGELYRVGQFVSADSQDAFRWYLRAAEQGHAAAMFRVSMAYRQGNGVAFDQSAAETWLQSSLDQGYSEALHFAGYRFESQSNMVQANQYYWQAAQAGLMRAQINLGVSYLMGNRGVVQDFEKAYYWFARATSAPLADYYRGQLLDHGRGVEANLPAAYVAYESAARVSLPEAKARVALFLDIGRGVKENPQQAAAYFAEFTGYESASDLNSVAWVLATHPAATSAHARLALQLAKQAATIEGNASSMDTLAAAYAASGDFTQAMSVQEQVIALMDDPLQAESHLANYREGRRWVDDLLKVSPTNSVITNFPEDTVVFTGEILRGIAGIPDNSANNLELDPGHSAWKVGVKIGQVEEGKLPQHLQDFVVFHLHSPTDLFGRLPGSSSVLSPPQGQYRFILTMKNLDYDLKMEAINP